MGLSNRNNLYFPVIMLLIIQTFLSSEFFWIIGFGLCIYYIALKSRFKIALPFKEYIFLLFFFIWGCFVGIVRISSFNENYLDWIRDVFYYSNPIVFMYLGAIYAKRKISIFNILNSFIVTSGIISCIQLIKIVTHIASLQSTISVQQWRNITGDSSVVIGISIAIILSGIIPKDKRLAKSILLFCTVSSILYFLLALSRTNMMIIFIMYAVLILTERNRKTILKKNIPILFALIIGGLLLTFLLPKSIGSAFINKLLSSFNEISVSNDWNNPVNVQAHWRGYETYCALEKWNDAGFFSKIFGFGFGERIYVGEYAYTLLKQVSKTGTPVDSIAVLHNGYATQLIKLGTLGVISYVVFYIKIAKKGWQKRKDKNNIIARILLSVALILLVQTFYLNGLFKDYVFFPIVIMVGYCSYMIKQEM